VLLEHMHSANRLQGALTDILNPLVLRVIGANINRRTLENVQCVLQVECVEDAGGGGIVKLITARSG
jgi:hypothetical protein